MSLVLMFFVSPALSATGISECAPGDAPALYTGAAATCDLACFIKQGYSDTRAECHPYVSQDIVGAVNLTAVHDYSGSGTDFSVWGSDDGGNLYCCAIHDDDQILDGFVLFGTYEDDVLAFSDGAGNDLDAHRPGVSLRAMIYGLGGDDVLRGSQSTNPDYGTVIPPYSTVPAEHLRGQDGADHIYGGAGNDVLLGGEGPDRLYGEHGADVIEGCGQTSCDPLLDDDIIEGGSGDDEIYGQEGRDIIRGNDGRDVIDGGDGPDDIRGGRHRDTLLGGPGDDELRGGSYKDIIYGDSGNDVIMGDGGDDELFGEAGEDIILGGPGSDVIYGGDHADRIKGGDGHDIMDGEAGADVLCDGEDGDVFHAGPFERNRSDTLWYAPSSDPNAVPPHPSSTGNFGDSCGHTSWDAFAGWCSADLVTEPPVCATF